MGIDGLVPRSAPVIVAGIDGSERSVAVLRWADQQARLLGAWLVAVTAYGSGLADETDSPEAAAVAERALERCLAQALSPERARLAVRWLDPGDPADALIRRRDWWERLVVIGRHHRAPLRPLGSVTARVVGHAPAPVAIVHEESTVRSTGRIVVGVDGSPYARRALQWAAHYAERTDVKIEAILAWSGHHWDHPSVDAAPGSRREIQLERLLHDELSRLLQHHPVDVAGFVRTGHPAEVLRDAVADAELLVVGSHGRTPVLGRLAGSVSLQLVQHCEAPVVVVSGASTG